MKKLFNKKDITKYALIASLYFISSIIIKDFRLGEAFAGLIFIDSMYFWPVTIGCLITNIIMGNFIDIVFGTLATIIGLLISINIKTKNYFIKLIPYVLVNVIIVSLILRYAYFSSLPYIYHFIYVLITESVIVLFLGYLLKNVYEKYKF